jgi:hypothetical protein
MQARLDLLLLRLLCATFSLLLEYSAAASNCNDSCGLTIYCVDALVNVFGAYFDRSFSPPNSYDVHLIIRIPLSSYDPSS